ncbi:orotidine-5'-phosphate decarboxylase [Tunturiibacter gelidoferens]|uniref:Orotidine 5'-phosphate decarboxylase n=1 Tax=Tunturiibacter gelidiferens TaxID=3069689 RepID=A0A9X0QF67_9BACT|nr:orotidine-5'-phosphate decarboxylase [Edaphobacter lichenicola]MBB5329270.1 orotidine-5'-phosphate decarboxylase [Edaphobacter lichenicola]
MDRFRSLKADLRDAALATSANVYSNQTHALNQRRGAYHHPTFLTHQTARKVKLIYMSDPKNRLAVALDYPDAYQAMKLVDSLGQTCQWFKVGMELYYAAGNDMIRQLRDRGFDVFLDLKLHDIPNTVAGAVRSATKAGASLLTIHASGGAAMMTAAAEAAKAPGSPRLLAVTVLTSMDAAQLAGTGITASPADQVLRLAKLARQSGIDGFVCSAEEVASVRAATGSDALLVIPGIRPTGADIGDQKRIATPTQAIAQGASMLVVGRPITQAADPGAVAENILDEIAQAEASQRK